MPIKWWFITVIGYSCCALRSVGLINLLTLPALQRGHSIQGAKCNVETQLFLKVTCSLQAEVLRGVPGPQKLRYSYPLVVNITGVDWECYLGFDKIWKDFWPPVRPTQRVIRTYHILNICVRRHHWTSDFCLFLSWICTCSSSFPLTVQLGCAIEYSWVTSILTSLVSQ